MADAASRPGPARSQSASIEVTCAECGCLVDRGVIVGTCARHPDCCCGHLPVRPEG